MKENNFEKSFKNFAGPCIHGVAVVLQTKNIEFILVAKNHHDVGFLAERWGMVISDIKEVKRVLVFEDVKENICVSCMEEK